MNPAPPVEVLVWMVQTDVIRVDDDVLDEVLSPGELSRAGALVHPEDRRRWKLARYWLRALLARRLGTRPSALRFGSGHHGKPHLLNATRPLHFNASHSAGWLAVALCWTGEVGIDLEVVRPDFPSMEVAEEFFTPAERRQLRAAAEAWRQETFFRLWTAKEALMKATGLGVALPPEQIDVRVDGRPGYASHPEFLLREESPSPGVRCALAVEAPAVAVTWRVLSGAAPRAGDAGPERLPKLSPHPAG